MTDKWNKELQNQNEDIVKKYIYDTSYPDIVKQVALKQLQDTDFYITGLYELLLNSINMGGLLDDFGNRLDGIENPDSDPWDPNNPDSPFFELDGKLKGISSELSEKFDEKLNDTKNTIKETESKFIQTNEQILAEVKSIEMSGKLTDNLASLYNRIEELALQATEDMKLVREVADDNVFKYKEKLDINPVWLKIKNEVSSIEYQLNEQEIDTNDYITEYDILYEYMTSLHMGSGRDTPIDGVIFISSFENYFNARHNTLVNMFNKLKSVVMDLSQDFVESSLSIADLNRLIISTNFERREIIKFFEELQDYRFLSVSEKSLLKEFYDNIQEQFIKDEERSDRYKNINIGDYELAYDNLVSYIRNESVFQYMDEETFLDGSMLENRFLNLFDERLNYYDELLEDNLSIINGFGEDVEYYRTAIDLTDRRLSLTAESVKAIGDSIKVSQASIDFTADSILQRITTTTIPRQIEQDMKNLNEMGENLYIASTSKSGIVSIASGATSSMAYQGSRYSDWITIPANMGVVLSIWDNYIDNQVKIAWYDNNKNFLEADVMTSNEKNFYLITSSPMNSAFGIVEVQRANDCRIQFEIGYERTTFKLALEDLNNNIVLARMQSQSRAEEMAYYINSTMDYQSYRFESKLLNILMDNSVTSNEKQELENYSEIMVRYHEEFIDTMDSIQVEHDDLDRYYEALMSDIFNLIYDQSSTTMVHGPLFSNKVERYMRELEKLNQFTIEYLDKLFEDSMDYWIEQSANILEVEENKRSLIQKAEIHAKNLANMRTFYSQEKIYRTEVEENLMDMVEGNILNAVDKVYVNDYIRRMMDEDTWYERQADIYNLGKAEFLRTREDVIDYTKAMLTVNTLNIDSSVDRHLFLDKFSKYFQAKENLFSTIIDATEVEYQRLQNMVSNSIALSQAKNEEFIRYQTIVEETQREINILEDSIKELRDAVPYTIQLNSDKGDKFTNGVIDTTLKCTIYRGNVDITDQIDSEYFVWTKRDKDGNDDLGWNAEHENVGNVIQIDHTDVDEKAIFRVEVFQEIGTVQAEFQQ